MSYEIWDVMERCRFHILAEKKEAGSPAHSSLGFVLLSLTVILHSLRPQPCENVSSTCLTPSNLQFAVLYSGIALASIGQGGSRFTLAAMGANQFDKMKDQGVFINWYGVISYASAVIGVTVIVYIEDNVGWGLGFGLCFISNLVGLAVFLLGNHYYHKVKPQRSPFTSLVRVIIAAIQKRKILLSSKMEDYYYGHNQAMEIEVSEPTKSLRFLNRAAQKTEGDTQLDGSIAKPWRLCSVQQVEDLKTLALTVDRHLRSYFKIPTGSMIVFTLTSTAISLAFIDRLVYPIWQKLTHQSPTPLQRIGVGQVFNVVGMATAALVESKRLKVAQNHHLLDQIGDIVPISVLWLVPQLAVVGFGEAFYYPGQITFFYQEFPKSLRSTATSMIALNVGIAFYLSTAMIDLIQKTTSWLPDNINEGRLDYVYWLLLVLGALNFGYFLICAKFYMYQNVLKGNDSSNQLE